MKDCMFHCPPDNLDVGDHWEFKCKGNPEVNSR